MVESWVLYPHLPHIQRGAAYPPGQVLVVGFFRATLGTGEAARLELAALRKAGTDACGLDISPAFGVEDLDIKRLAQREDAPTSGPLLLHCNAPEAGRALRYLGPHLTTNRPLIGYWAWELDRPPQGWENAYRYFDEIWVPSHYAAHAFAHSPVPLRVVPHPVEILPDGEHSLEELGIGRDEGRCRFLCMADCRSDLARKNILGAIRAFHQARPPHSTLIVKLHHTDHAGPELQRIFSLAAACPDVQILDRLFSISERDSLLHRCDVLLSLHRAEGFGLPLAEAMRLGKAVIGTDWSGNRDFMTPDNSLLIPCRLVPVHPDTLNYKLFQNGCNWAEPDLDAAAQAILRLAESPDYRGKLGEKARRDSAARFDPVPFAALFPALTGGSHAPEQR